MTHVYAPTYQAIKTAQVLENSALEGAEFVTTQVKLAVIADSAYDRLRAVAVQYAIPAGLTAKEAAAAQMVSVALALHETHCDTGSKIAALPEYLAEVLQKLAAAVLVDEVLTEQLPMLEGETKIAAERCQLLGREYAMMLVGEILK